MHLISTPHTKHDVVIYPDTAHDSTVNLFEGAEVGTPVTRTVDASFFELREASGKYDLRLDDALELADGYFRSISERIGGTVIPHTWVVLLAPAKNPPKKNSSQELTTMLDLSLRYRASLGARVEKLPGVSIKDNDSSVNIKPEHTRLTDPADAKLAEFENQHRIDHGWALSDIADVRQFMCADPSVLDAATDIADVAPTLVDLDVRF